MKDEIYDWRHPYSKMHEKQAVDTKNNTKKKLVRKIEISKKMPKMTEEQLYIKRQNEMTNHHLKEMDKRKADAYNIGWAAGDNFIHSKTSKGRLYTTRKGNKYKHEWEYND